MLPSIIHNHAFQVTSARMPQVKHTATTQPRLLTVPTFNSGN
jgi:hypothetical protein